MARTLGGDVGTTEFLRRSALAVSGIRVLDWIAAGVALRHRDPTPAAVMGIGVLVVAYGIGIGLLVGTRARAGARTLVAIAGLDSAFALLSLSTHLQTLRGFYFGAVLVLDVVILVICRQLARERRGDAAEAG